MQGGTVEFVSRDQNSKRERGQEKKDFCVC